jgi:hypothetical protein
VAGGEVCGVRSLPRCRQVVGRRTRGRARGRVEAIEVSSRRFEIYVYDPEGTELEVSGVEDEALPDLVGKFDAVEEYPAGAWNAARRPADHEKAVSEGSRGC